MLVTGFIPVINVFKLDAEDGRLQAIKPAVYAFYFVDVFFLRTVVGKEAGAAGEIVVVSDDGTAVAVSAEVFTGVKAEGAGQAKGAGLLAVKSGKMRLGAVFNHQKVVAVADRFDAVYSRWLAVKVDRDDGFSSRSNFFFEPGGVQVIKLVNIHKDGAGSGLAYSFRRGDEGIGSSNYFITGANADCFEADVNGICPTGTAYAVFYIIFGGKSLFKSFHIFSAHKSGVIED
jgi:hypothetical protein